MLWRAVLPYRGTWTGWKNVQAANSLTSTKENEKPCTWEGVTPHTSMGLTSWKVTWLRKTWWTHQAEVNNAPLWHGAPTASWAISGEVLPAGRGRWSFSTHIWSGEGSWSSSGLLDTRNTQTSWSKSSEGPQGRFTGWQHLTYRETERAVTAQPGEDSGGS